MNALIVAVSLIENFNIIINYKGLPVIHSDEECE